METGKLTELINSAKAAQERAVAPYSNFQVGAALETESGKIYSGCNIEVSSYGLTICAERVAIFKALSEGEKDFTQLVITAKSKDFCPPCGACRQVLIDFAANIKIFMLNSEGETKETTIAEGGGSSGASSAPPPASEAPPAADSGEEDDLPF